MIIRKLNLDHFGKFHDTEILLEPGINIIYGGNESGKSTIHSFIQCMLFGAERLRGRGSGRDIYTKYQPWEGPTGYGGRMTFEHQDKTWRIVRNFQKENESFALIDEQEGRQVLKNGEDISALIGGMNVSNYRNSISVGQLAAQPDGQFTMDMQSYMANMASGADASVDVGKAMAYLKEERKKAVLRVSEEELIQYQEQAEALRRELQSQDALILQQKQLEQEKKHLKDEIETLENRADEAMKADRNERIRAIQLIQENNDVAAMYKAKRTELREMEASAGDQSYQKHISEVMADFEACQEKLDDNLSRCNELEEQSEGNIIRNMAIILPVAAAAVGVWLAGGLFGMDAGVRTKVAALLAVLSGALAVILMRASGGRRRRIAELQEEAEELEARQKAVLKQYQIEDIEALRLKGSSQQSRQEAVVRLRKEMNSLRERYDELQKPLKPYLDKYGDSITLESSVGLEEKKQIEQLRRQMADVARQAEQLEWRLTQMSDQQVRLQELDEKIQQMKDEKKGSYEDIMAIDICQNTIKEITAQIHTSFGSQLADYISQLFQYMTDGSHQKLSIDEKFQIQIDDGRQLLQPHQLSAGTVDQIYFSERMAVGQMLFSEPMPLILDDSFALYDDRRLQNTLIWLSGQENFSQVIIFTCHHREAEILTEADCECHVIDLESLSA